MAACADVLVHWCTGALVCWCAGVMMGCVTFCLALSGCVWLCPVVSGIVRPCQVSTDRKIAARIEEVRDRDKVGTN